jgi:hypothetical protein
MMHERERRRAKVSTSRKAIGEILARAAVEPHLYALFRAILGSSA